MMDERDVRFLERLAEQAIERAREEVATEYDPEAVEEAWVPTSEVIALARDLMRIDEDDERGYVEYMEAWIQYTSSYMTPEEAAVTERAAHLLLEDEEAQEILRKLPEP